MDVPETLTDRLVEVFKALADPTRLRILGLLAERELKGKELSETLAIGAPTVSHHVAKLVNAGLVQVTRDGQSRIYMLNETALRTLAQLASTHDQRVLSVGSGFDESADDQEARERAKVIRDFFVGARLKQIPAQRKKRVIVLQHLMRQFEPGRPYPEKEINSVLREAHDDVATLRRELVDYGYMTREGGVYHVALALPERDVQINQEITGDEHAWLRTLLSRATT